MQIYNPEVEKLQYTSEHGWASTATSKKVNNGQAKINTYSRKKAELSSSVFELPDYTHHAPIQKKQAFDINNLNAQQKKQNHMYSDVLGACSSSSNLRLSMTLHGRGGATRTANRRTQKDLHLASNTWSTADLKSQLKKDYSAYSTKGQKYDQMKSSLDTHAFEAALKYQTNEQQSSQQEEVIKMNGTSSKATKVRDLSSDILGVGSSLARYQSITAENQKGEVVDLDLRALPQQTKEDDLKKIANVKHVISATVDQDSITSVCTGTGRIKIRLGNNETAEKVMLQFLKAGYAVSEHSENPKKKTNFTQEMSMKVQSP